MKKALIIYGSTTGNTERMASIINDALQEEGLEATAIDVTGASVADLTGPHDIVLLGCPAYGDDEIELQEDFSEYFEKLDGCDLSGRKFAVFAPGDRSYTFFCGSVDMIAERIESLGGTLVEEGLKVEGDPDDALTEIKAWSQSISASL